MKLKLLAQQITLRSLYVILLIHKKTQMVTRLFLKIIRNYQLNRLCLVKKCIQIFFECTLQNIHENLLLNSTKNKKSSCNFYAKVITIVILKIIMTTIKKYSPEIQLKIKFVATISIKLKLNLEYHFLYFSSSFSCLFFSDGILNARKSSFTVFFLY